MADTNLTSLDLSSGLKMGGTTVLNTNVDTLPKTDTLALGIAAGNAGLMNWVNPEGVDIIVTNLTINLTTVASGTPTADFGVATSGTGTSKDTLIDGADINSAAVVLNSIKHAGTNGLSCILVPAGQYITGTASTDPLSVVGTIYVTYVIA